MSLEACVAGHLHNMKGEKTEETIREHFNKWWRMEENREEAILIAIEMNKK